MKRKTVWKLLVVFAILTGGIIYYFRQPQEDTERHTVSVASLNGTALIERSGMKISAYEGMKLKNGDSIRVTSGQDVTLGMDGIPFAVLETGTELIINNTEEKKEDSTRIRMEEGSVLFFSDASLSGRASKAAAELSVLAGGLWIDGGASTFLLTVQTGQEETKTFFTVFSGRVTTSPLAGGKKESIAAGMTATFLLDETGVSACGQKEFALSQCSDNVLEKLLTADKAQSPFCVSREELKEELEEREAVTTGKTGQLPLLTPTPKPTPMPTTTPGPTPEPVQNPTQKPILTPTPESAPEPELTSVPTKIPVPTVTPASELTLIPTATPLPTVSPDSQTTELPLSPTPTSKPTDPPVVSPAAGTDSVLGSKFAELIGQTPKTDDTDGVLTYYEFAIGMLEAAEPGMKESGVSMESILIGFAFRLIAGGVDINRLDINEPMPRSEAALFLWYGAQSIGDTAAMTDTSDTASYVTDLSDCTAARQRAIGFLYAEGYEEGYHKEGQSFRPKDILTTEEGKEWIRKSTERWKP